jgi:hypothetical protein
MATSKNLRVNIVAKVAYPISEDQQAYLVELVEADLQMCQQYLRDLEHYGDQGVADLKAATKETNDRISVANSLLELLKEGNKES